MKALLTSLAGLCLAGPPSVAEAATFVVNDSGDTRDANAGDAICADLAGKCTLRAAIEQANTLAGEDTITFALSLPATINLSQELAVSQSVTISGPGARSLILQRDPSVARSRILSVTGPFDNPATVSVSRLTLANGSMGTGSSSQGGAIRNAPGNRLNLTEVTVRNNSAEVGAGIFNYGQLNIIGSTLSDNVAVSEGGAIDNQVTASASLTNTTISGNSAGNYGGGIVNFNQLTLNNVTLTRNAVSQKGGGLYSEGTSVFCRNTLIVSNTASVSGPDVWGTLTSHGHNLVGRNDGSNVVPSAPPGSAQANGDRVGTAASALDAMLGALQDNGGQTDTHALSGGSPAIDTGDDCVVTSCAANGPAVALSSDQRGPGFARQMEGALPGPAIVDIGAVERSVPGPAFDGGSFGGGSFDSGLPDGDAVDGGSSNGDVVDRGAFDGRADPGRASGCAMSGRSRMSSAVWLLFALAVARGGKKKGPAN